MAIIKPNNNTLSAITALPTGLGGKVLQVVEGTCATGSSTSTTSTSYTDTNLSAAITPSSSSNKILCLVSGDMRATTGNGYNVQGRINIVRGSTEIIDGDVYIDGESNTYDPKVGAKIFLSKLDSPSTTSSTTYKVQVKSVGSNYSPTIAFSANNTSTITLIEISA